MKTMKSAILAAGLLMSSGAVYADDVTLYSSNSEDSVFAALDAIKAQDSGLDVSVVKGGSGTLLKRIQAESAKPAADVFWSSGFATLANFSENFAAYGSKHLDAIPMNMRGTDNLWTGTNVHVMVLMVNESRLNGMKKPATWSDLFKDEWKGKVAMSNPSSSSSAYAQLYGVWKMLGEDGVRKLAATVATQGSTSGVYKGVAQGEYPVGITMEYAAQRYVAGGQKEIKLVYPSEGTFLSPEGLILVKGAPHMEAGKRLYDALLSKETQSALFKVSFRRPSRGDLDDVITASGLPAMKDVNVFEVDQSAAAAARDELLKIWTKYKP